MANINITGQGTFAANSYTVPSPMANSSSVSFHSADKKCKVCFGNSATFGVSSFVVQTGAPQSLTLEAVQSTSFSVVGETDNCSSGNLKDTNYNITMGSGFPGKKHDKK